ncbi:2-(3-amino-3-carboxypropyl)histidine synthase subunit 2 isoform X2 [Sminthopsis crassicaudata]|uniref:2-(3-amino-3-carboxypropyl)histidine synthase subunit 2 isoform X2 n=1 Tax=Sminthopsis crassicaudata TaxID=9301 RepID=UPI003D68501D
MEDTFSSPAEATLQREAGVPEPLTPLTELGSTYELERVQAFLLEHEAKRVALQFPDELLGDSVAVARTLEEMTGAKTFVLGDTAYGSCCVDVLGAEQASADALVHFGPACLSPLSGPLPVIHVLGRRPVALELCAEAFRALHPDPVEPVVLLSEPSCAHALDSGRAQAEGPRAVRARARSHYLVERARDARVVGLLAGAPGGAGHREALSHLRKLVQAAGKRAYVLSLGRPSPAKLANFPEVDVFVLLACPWRTLDRPQSGASRGFFRPMLTPYELEAACNPARGLLGFGPYLTHYSDLLPGSPFHVPVPPPESELWDAPDVSLITGELRPPQASASAYIPDGLEASALCQRPQLELAESSPAASFLSSRTWRGLEPQLGQTAPMKAVAGRRGVPIAYEDEPGS